MIYLASQSPRRKQLMELGGLKFIVMPSDAEEIVPESFNPREAAEYLSTIKAEALVSKTQKGDIIIGADTVVTFKNKIFGKPHNPDEAYNMLKELSGNTHSVITGVTIIKRRSEPENITFSVSTDVTFYRLTEKDIKEYIATDEPYDKAGGYGIQEKGGLFVEKINGDFFNVVGLPVARVVREISRGAV